MGLAPAVSAAMTESTEVINVNGVDRTYVVYTPESPTMMVVCLHGAYGDGHEACETQCKPDAEAMNYVAICPDGSEAVTSVLPEDQRAQWEGVRGWSNQGPWGGLWIMSEDGLYMRAIGETLPAMYNVPKDKVFMSGFSSGAGMVLRMWCEQPDLYYGFVAGSPVPEATPDLKLDFLFDDPGYCLHTSPYMGYRRPMVQLGGAQDHYQPGLEGLKFMYDAWLDVAVNQTLDCNLSPGPYVSYTGEGGNITCYQVDDCPLGGASRNCQYINGLHAWPTDPEVPIHELPPFLYPYVGNYPAEFPGTSESLKFFLKSNCEEEKEAKGCYCRRNRKERNLLFAQSEMLGGSDKCIDMCAECAAY